jgi:hypothetical protein
VKEAGNGKGLIAISKDLPVYGIFVEIVGNDGYGRIYGYHKDDSNNTARLSVLYSYA